MNTLPEEQGMPSDFEYVGFGVRVLAAVVDTVVMMVLAVPLMIFGFFSGTFHLWDILALSAINEFVFGHVLPALLIIALWVKYRATPGKMLFGAVVVDARTGQPITPLQGVLRYLGYFVSSMILFLGFIWVAFDARKQGWHDKIAGTVVIRAKQ